MEELNKTQVILLALLISFVTSIATGIATVSLVEKAPTDVTRVISRIIEQPVEIETIVPGETEVITKTETVIVKEEDAIVAAIDRVSQSMVRIFSPEREERGRVEAPRTFLGIGFVISQGGVIATDPALRAENTEYEIVLPTGARISAEVREDQTLPNALLLQPLVALDDEGEVPAFTPVVFEKEDVLGLGQTVIALAGEETTEVAIGSITSLTPNPNTTQGQALFTQIHTSLDNSITAPGMPLINTSGRVIGRLNTEAVGVFIPLLRSGDVEGASTSTPAQ